MATRYLQQSVVAAVPGKLRSSIRLILTRRVGETVIIGNEVTVTVLGVKGNQFRIGVNAPKDVPVHREEIYERINREDDQDSRSAALVALLFDDSQLGRIRPLA